MNFLDIKYARLCAPYLQKFKETKPGHFNFRCPKCGDSKKDKNKARGWFYTTGGKTKYKCHNCFQGEPSIKAFLKAHVPELYSNYLLETVKGPIKEPSKPKEIKFNRESLDKLKKVKKTLKPESYFRSSLDNKEAIEYLERRQIPSEHFSSIYYTENFKTITNKLIPGKFLNENEYGNKYLIFPFYTPDRKFVGYQGRSLNTKNKAFRYITIAFNKEKYPPVFGLENINKNERTWIFEGPIDSLFLDNSIALCGAGRTLNLDLYPNKVFVLDPDTRNKNIIEIYKDLIKKGESLVILPKKYSGMDTNDLVLQGINPKKLYEQHIYKGFKASINLAKWNR